MRFLVKAVGLSAALLFTGCNEEADPGSNSTESAVGVVTAPVSVATINGAVVQGLVRNAVVTASRWQTAGNVVAGSAMTDASGNYSLTLPDAAAGYVRLEMSLSTDPARPTEMLCVAARCGAASFGEWYPLTTNPRMSTWATVGSTGVVTTMPMTPFSTMTVRYAEKIGGGSLVAVNYARKRIALLLGPSGGALGAVPGNVTDPAYVRAAGAASLKWSMLVAAFAELAESQGVDLATVIDRYSAAFQQNHGQLLQAEDGISPQPGLASIIQAAIAVDGVARGTASSALQTWLAQQQPGQLNLLPALNFDSGAFVSALGPMGQDVLSVMQAKGASSLQGLIVDQLSKFRWLASQESTAVASISAQTVIYSMLGSAILANLPAGMPATPIELNPGPLNVTLNTGTRVLTLTGTEQGMTVNLSITLTALNAGSTAHPYVFTAVGTVSNANVSASINGTLRIDPTTTNLTPLLDASRGIFNGNTSALNDLLVAVGGILQSGRGVFTVYGTAGMQSLVNPGSQLSISGKAALNVDMAGGTGGAVKASGSVAYGTLTLPNGDYYTLDTAVGEFLTFALNDNDGTFNSRFSAYTLSLPQTIVKASGKLTGLGGLLTNLRNTLTSQLAVGQLNLTQLMDSLLNFDYSQLALTLRGQANILGSYNHIYNLSLLNGGLTISQPNSTATAIRARGGSNGAVIWVGPLTYVMGLDLRDVRNPAVVVGDNVSGGLWRADWASLSL